ncbi:MAG: SMP-30/gluconolactonase/LRE family protein [Opitutales bacterium]
MNEKTPVELPANSSVQAVSVIPEVVDTGGLAINASGVLYFANYLHSGTIGQYNLAEVAPPTTFIDLNEWMTSPKDRSPSLRGLAVDTKGRLVGADAGTGKVIRISPNASKVEILADSYRGMLLRSVHDVALSPDGTIYASSPEEGVIYRIRPEEGKVDIVNRDLIWADGLAISPDGSRLVVTEPAAARLLVFLLQDDSYRGVPATTLDFSDTGDSPHGVAFDELGRLYVGMGDLGSVHVFDLAETRLLRTYDVGGSANRLFLQDGTLWVSGGRSEGLRRIRLN